MGPALENPPPLSWRVGVHLLMVSFSIWVGVSACLVSPWPTRCCQNRLPSSPLLHGVRTWAQKRQLRRLWIWRKSVGWGSKSEIWSQVGQGARRGSGNQLWVWGQGSLRLHLVICKMQWKCPPHSAIRQCNWDHEWKHMPPCSPPTPLHPGLCLPFCQHLSAVFFFPFHSHSYWFVFKS